MQIRVKKNQSTGIISLIFEDRKGNVLDEQLLTAQLARALRATLEAVVSGRTRERVASEYRTGFQLPAMQANLPPGESPVME